MKISSLCLASLPLAAAFAPQANNGMALHKSALNAEAATLSSSKPVFDPLGLYPEDSPERLAGPGRQEPAAGRR